MLIVCMTLGNKTNNKVWQIKLVMKQGIKFDYVKQFTNMTENI